MKKVKVIARRYRVGANVLIICGIILLVLGVLLLNEMFDEQFMGIIGLIGGVICLVVGLWMKLSPNEVIIKSDDRLLICFLFRTVVVPISSIAHVSYAERSSAFGGAGMKLSWFTLHRENRDVRNIAIAYEEDGCEQIVNLYDVEGASSVKIAIESLIEEYSADRKE